MEKSAFSWNLWQKIVIYWNAHVVIAEHSEKEQHFYPTLGRFWGVKVTELQNYIKM